jgi:hypothetical protein
MGLILKILMEFGIDQNKFLEPNVFFETKIVLQCLLRMEEILQVIQETANIVESF